MIVLIFLILIKKYLIKNNWRELCPSVLLINQDNLDNMREEFTSLDIFII